jgi:hypothetical protein
MPLDPSKNLYNVAPVGGIVVIGRSASLKTGLTHEQVLNLVAWLVLSGQVSRQELESELSRAVSPTFIDPIVDQVSLMRDGESEAIGREVEASPAVPVEPPPSAQPAIKRMFVTMAKDGTATVTTQQPPIAIGSGRSVTSPPNRQIPVTLTPPIDHDGLVRKWTGGKDNG